MTTSHLAPDVLDLGPEARNLPHAVCDLPRGQALHHLVQLSEALKTSLECTLVH